MNKPLFKPEPIHWWILLIAILFGIVLFFAFHVHVY